MAQGNERLREGRGGWVRYESDDLDVPVFVRFAPGSGGALEPVDLFLPSVGGPLSPTLLRRVPLGRIEAWVNADPDFVLRGIRLPGPDLRRLAAHFDTQLGNDETHWVALSMKAQETGTNQAPAGELTSDKDDEPAARQPTHRDVRLDIPAARPYGDDFYRTVADAYRTVAGRTRAPNGFIADANGVAISKVNRWVKIAREKGFLPEGRIGKAG